MKAQEYAQLNFFPFFLRIKVYMYYLFLSVLNLALFPQNFDNLILSPLQLVTFAQHSQLLTALLENISKSIQIFLIVPQ